MNDLQSIGLEPGHLLLLAWSLLLVALAVLMVVSINLIRRSFAPSGPVSDELSTSSAQRSNIVTTSILIGVGILFLALAVSAVWVMGSLARAAAPPREPAFTIEVIGHEWWWEVRYVGDEPYRNFTTANQIHIPVGETVAVKLVSRNVIHSFWVPALGGKTDLIPGQINTTWIQANKPGVYRGQCAEYCGLQHANMALFVVAEEPKDFDAWWNKQLEPALPIETARARDGYAAFVQKCGICHAVRGTRAQGIVGPDLSHLMQRRTLAAGTLPNTSGNLAGWIADPQHVKTGNKMPRLDISPTELQGILAFLKTLE